MYVHVRSFAILFRAHLPLRTYIFGKRPAAINSLSLAYAFLFKHLCWAQPMLSSCVLRHFLANTFFTFTHTTAQKCHQRWHILLNISIDVRCSFHLISPWSRRIMLCYVMPRTIVRIGTVTVLKVEKAHDNDDDLTLDTPYIIYIYTYSTIHTAIRHRQMDNRK